MKARLIRRLRKAGSPKEWLPVGHVVDHPRAHVLVRMGHAEPADEECQQAHGLTPAQMSAAQRSADRVAKGIHPDDYGAYDAGLISGYNPDGTPIPGPKYVEPEPEDEEDEEPNDE